MHHSTDVKSSGSTLGRHRPPSDRAEAEQCRAQAYLISMVIGLFGEDA
jgi:hypothetical protein